MASSLTAHGGTTASACTNARLAQDELHESAGLREMATGTSVLGDLQQQHESPDSPARAADMTTLYAFLSEMEQLDDDDDASNTTEDETSRSPAQKPDSTAPYSLALDPLDPFAVQATAVGASVAMEHNYQKTKPKKKKLSTYARTLREKAALKLEIAHMEHTVRHIKREHYKRFALRNAKRWGPIIQHELQQTELLEAERFKLRRRVGDQQQTRQEALNLIDKMRTMLQASSTAFERIPFEPRLECEKDVAIFQLLARNVSTKCQVLDHALAPSSSTPEMSFGKVRSGGMIVEHGFVRMVPFDVSTTSSIAWDCASLIFGSGNAGLNSSLVAGTISIKQELMVPLSSRQTVQVAVRAVCKRVVNEQRTVILWEGLSQWMLSEGGMITTTHEQGSIIFEPVEGESLSSVKGFSQLTPVDLKDTWMHVLQTKKALARVVLPSHEKVIDARHQFVENHMLDAARRAAHTVVAP